MNTWKSQLLYQKEQVYYFKKNTDHLSFENPKSDTFIFLV